MVVFGSSVYTALQDGEKLILESSGSTGSGSANSGLFINKRFSGVSKVNQQLDTRETPLITSPTIQNPDIESQQYIDIPSNFNWRARSTKFVIMLCVYITLALASVLLLVIAANRVNIKATWNIQTLRFNEFNDVQIANCLAAAIQLVFLFNVWI